MANKENEGQDMALIMRALEAASVGSKTDKVVETWVGLPNEPRSTILEEVSSAFVKTSESRRSKMDPNECTCSARELKFEALALDALKEKTFSLTKGTEGEEMLTTLLGLGRRGGNAKQTARCYELLFPTFLDVQNRLDDLAETDPSLRDNDASRGKTSLDAKAKSLRKSQFPSDVEQFEAVVATFAVILTCTMNKKRLLFKCSAQACPNQETELGAFKKCGGCKAVWYCSRECQVRSWKLENHKAECKVLAVTAWQKQSEKADAVSTEAKEPLGAVQTPAVAVS